MSVFNLNKNLGNYVRTTDRTGAVFQNQYSYLFDGVNEHIELPDINSLDGISALTVSCRIKKPILTINEAIVVKWDFPNQASWAFQTSNFNGNELQVFIAEALGSAGDFSGFTTNANLLINTWYHVAFVYNGATSVAADRIKIYVNGIEPLITITNTPPISLTSATSTVKIGKFGGALDRFFNGNIDEVRIWTRAFSTTDILDDVNGGTPKTPNTVGLISSYRMGDGDIWNGINWNSLDAVSGNNGLSNNMEEADRVLDV